MAFLIPVAVPAVVGAAALLKPVADLVVKPAVDLVRDGVQVVGDLTRISASQTKAQLRSELERLQRKLNECMATGAELQRQLDEYTKQRDDLKIKLELEIEIKIKLQLELELKIKLILELELKIKLQLEIELKIKLELEDCRVAKGELQRQLEECRVAKVRLQLELEVCEAKRDELQRQLEDTRKAALALMDAADAYQQDAEKQIKANVAELEGTRKAAVVFMDAADRYQRDAEKRIRAMVEELKDTRKAALLFMDAADRYQLAEKKMRMENCRLRSELLVAEKKCSLSEAEIRRLRMQVGVLAEGNEKMKAYDSEKVNELEEFKRKVVENQGGKEASEEVGRDKDAQADKLRVELEELSVSMSQLRASYEELYAKNSCLNDEKNDEKNSIQEALDAC